MTMLIIIMMVMVVVMCNDDGSDGGADADADAADGGDSDDYVVKQVYFKVKPSFHLQFEHQKPDTSTWSTLCVPRHTVPTGNTYTALVPETSLTWASST